MKKGLTIGLALALLIPALVMAQQDCQQRGPRGGGHGFDAACHDFKGHPGGPGHRGEGMGIRHLLAVGDKINLTDKQQAKLEEMMVDFKLQSIDLKAETEKAQVALHALKRDDAVEADVMRAIDDVARLRAEMKKMQYRHHQQVKAVLTEDQVDQLKELRKERFKECGKHGEKPGHGQSGKECGKHNRKPGHGRCG